MRNKIIIAITLIFAVLISSLVSGSDQPEIKIALEYGKSTSFDSGNDGVEPGSSVIEFTVKNTDFNWYVNKENLCAKWEIYSIDNNEITVTCHGSGKCCNFLGLNPAMPEWDDNLYLSYGKYGSSLNNKVSARVIYVDYNLENDNPYSRIYYSDYDYLYAVFLDDGSIKSEFSASSITGNDYGLNITSPMENDVLSNGENIYLNFTTNTTVSANYSLDGKTEKDLGTGKAFSSLLEGNLQYSTLSNGSHNITINLVDENSNTSHYSYYFDINDLKAPKISVLFNSSNLNNSVITSLDNEKNISIISDEFASIKYSLNNEPYSNELNLGQLKSTEINLSFQKGTNTLKINATDLHENSNIHAFYFDFEYAVACSDGIKNGDETGIDCGGPCGPCVEFNISTVKLIYHNPDIYINVDTYDYNEDVLVDIFSRANSVVNFIVLHNNKIVDSKEIKEYSPNHLISLITFLDNINDSGLYSINANSTYMGHVENKAIYFTVNDPPETLNVQINANSTNINEKEDIRFNAEVTGSTGNVNYKWDFGNDGSVDSTSSSIVKKYNSNGTYQIKLTVVDDIDESSALETITVKKLFDVEITVKNETGSVIEKADIEFNGEHKNTSSSGKASFKINEGTYELKVEKEKYFDYVNGSVEINSNKNILVKLEYDDTDDSDPEIIIVSPGKNKEFQSSTVTITYKVNDNSKVNCTLQINEQGNWWTDKETHTNPDKNKEKQFTINNLNDGEYQYRIKCIDSGKNYGFSETRKFYVNIPEASATSSKSSGSNTDDVIENEQIESLLMRIEQVSSELEKLPKNEKDVIEIMKINEKIEDARKKLRWYERDLSNLVWRKLDDAELKKEEENIYQKIEDLKNEIPARLEVTDSNEFVAYPSEEDVQEIISKYLDSEPNSYSERTKNSIAKKNNKIQKLLTVTTKAMVVNIEYLSGQKGKITLVEKSIELDKISDDYSDNMFLIEYIPKEIAENTNQIEFLFDYDTIIEDPLIKITNKDITSFAYYINKDIQVEEIKKTKTLIVDDDSENSGNSITGFSIFTDIKPALIETGNTRLIIEIIIIIVLLVIYLGYSVKNPKIKYYLFNRNSIKKIDEIKEKIEKAKNKLTDGNYDDAKSIYSEIQSAFKEIPYDLRKEVYADIMLLSNKIDLFYINNLIDDANESLDDGNVKKAIEKYNKVRQLYVNLGPKFKEEIIRKCKKLVSRISNKNEK